jgi:hypothetical protein
MAAVLLAGCCFAAVKPFHCEAAGPGRYWALQRNADLHHAQAVMCGRWKDLLGSLHLLYADGGANPPAKACSAVGLCPCALSGLWGAIGAQYAGGAIHQLRPEPCLHEDMTAVWPRLPEHLLVQKYVQKFRLNKDMIDWLYVTVLPRLQPEDTPMHAAIPPRKRLAITMHCIATAPQFGDLADTWGIGTTTVHMIVHDTVQVLEEVLVGSSVCFPCSEAALQQLIDGFEQMMGLPQCAGANDGAFISPLLAACGPVGSWLPDSASDTWGVTQCSLPCTSIEQGWRMLGCNTQ